MREVPLKGTCSAHVADFGFLVSLPKAIRGNIAMKAKIMTLRLNACPSDSVRVIVHPKIDDPFMMMPYSSVWKSPRKWSHLKAFPYPAAKCKIVMITNEIIGTDMRRYLSSLAACIGEDTKAAHESTVTMPPNAYMMV